ncbi:MAG: FAD-linked oxidase C-terminal domain-containing protein [Bacteroidota bacterium]|nr:FAD-linked oxidase C-terminal domain-containing protein [Bacteroidota bacterium]
MDPLPAAEINSKIEGLKNILEGDVFLDPGMLLLYATDASAYKETPLAVIRPKNKKDIKNLIIFCNKNKIPLIPRTAGTSLAGQVVGSGIIADVSKYMTRILEVNISEQWVRVEPGVVLDELNQILEKDGLFFAPETSTSNRCMMAGMLGNNSCGAHSILYGSTRDHTLEVTAFLSDGSEASFGALKPEEFYEKCKGDKLENTIYKEIHSILSNDDNRKEIEKEYPDPSLNRRNTGYVLDLLAQSRPFNDSGKNFNMCKLLAGSEGTLAFTTEIKLNLVPLPPKYKALICVHFNSLESSFLGNLAILKYKPGAVEMMDRTILELTKDNITQQRNRFFVEGSPAVILIAEFARNSMEEIQKIAKAMEKDMRSKGLAYHFPVVEGSDIEKVWDLRKAGLGILSNMKGDAKPVPVIEDTAVKVEDLPVYMREFRAILDKYNKDCVYYAHIGSGEIHLRPVLNLKDPEDVELFHTIAMETAKLVKKYNGSLSGEHGDGRLRGEFIPIMIGEKNYQLLKRMKDAWDPNHIFNPGKIVDSPRMNTFLRYEPGIKTLDIDTIFDFSSTDGYIRAAEMCTGSGDCRKSELIGGTMCPSFMATRDEKNSTRARANMLRELLSKTKLKNPFNQPELYDILDLCLSCKACKSECPSNVDMTKLKAEFMQHYYDANGIPLRTRLIAYITSVNKLGSLLPGIFNFVISNTFLSGLFKKFIGFAKERSIPLLGPYTITKWARRNLKGLNSKVNTNRSIYLFIDEFTNYNDTNLGELSIRLLTSLGFRVIIPKHYSSGRTFLSKGLLRTARKIAIKNVQSLHALISKETPLIGIEPSAILTFRDEYPELTGKMLKDEALELAKNSFMIDEFIANEMDKGNIAKELFTDKPLKIKLHGHCQQKSIASTGPTKAILSFPKNYHVDEIPSGCCGMAGSFGYEKEHYELSMRVGELVLFPEVRNTGMEIEIAAPGTSCRHQIKDGTQREAKHPVQILYEALK